MIRRSHGLRQQQHALRPFAWLHVDIKNLALASAVTACVLSGGATLLSGRMTKQKTPHAPPTTSTTSSHPLLGLNEAYSPLPGLPTSQKAQQSGSLSDAQDTPTDNITNRVMHQPTVTINGESIEVPPSGTSHQTIKNPDGSQTEVDIQHDQTQVDGVSRSNTIIDSRSTASNSSTSLNSRITITH